MNASVAATASLKTGRLAAGLLLLPLLRLALHRRVPLPAGEPPALRPRQLAEPELAFPFGREVGSVLVRIAYRVPPANTRALSAPWTR